ncbi:hypothetical protein ACEQ38_09305 [Ralstonia syzygii subsp. celebesensis]|uniref:Uncharacterized protein n=2 Tax=Ralstonia syzygii subsp. celebesensis TaxID=1310168 RepID=A0A1U9VFH7_9RALS|nr:hypothetical protein [Ralstonia syzygii]AQW29063.1 hypothetical protein B0B51_02855 [blood disease bacterium A2-HR MARDI]CCA79332.1 hypothetical protein BDB_50041 [blood disease bacterium R229]
MAHPDVLLAIVQNGNDLTLTSAVSPDTLRRLANAAQQSGARLNVTTQLHPDLIRELLAFGKAISFVDGLANFKKD